MQLINHNAIQHLYEMAESLANEPHESWQCIYLRLRSNHAYLAQDLYQSFIVHPLNRLLEPYQGNIYFCSDGDIFILFQGTMKPVMQKLEGHFGDTAPHSLPGQAGNNLLQLFSFALGKKWEGFYMLCESKYLQWLAAKEKARGTRSSVVEATLKPAKHANKDSRQLAMPAILPQVHTPAIAVAGDI
jgi:hypothetical protein